MLFSFLFASTALCLGWNGDIRGRFPEAEQPPRQIRPGLAERSIVVLCRLPVNALAAPQDLQKRCILLRSREPFAAGNELTGRALHHAPIVPQNPPDLPEPERNKSHGAGDRKEPSEPSRHLPRLLPHQVSNSLPFEYSTASRRFGAGGTKCRFLRYEMQTAAGKPPQFMLECC